MRNSRAALAAALLSVSTLHAFAQTATPEAIVAFVEAYPAATAKLEKIPRWEYAICPTTVGLAPAYAKFINDRVKKVAADAGPPVDPDPNCNSNIDIVFTTTPQGLMDGIRQKNPVYLGYYDSSSQADEMAKVLHPIQSWYTTETRDVRGKPLIDSRNTRTTSGAIGSGSVNSTGSHLNDGLRSAFYHAVIVADPSRLADHEVGALADQIAMLALSQPASRTVCHGLPSIANLTTPNCGKPQTALTKSDAAYLAGLYKPSLGGNLQGQKTAIAFQMRAVLN
ncbi:MAG: hypothetical protein RL274_1981 [Pseudomonadota bacterium]|jgi:hypothetical protein